MQEVASNRLPAAKSGGNFAVASLIYRCDTFQDVYSEMLPQLLCGQLLKSARKFLEEVLSVGCYDELISFQRSFMAFASGVLNSKFQRIKNTSKINSFARGKTETD